MTVMRALGGKRTWVGLGGAVLATLVLLALGALLTVQGVIPHDMQRGWILGSYGLAGLTGACLGSRRGKGTLVASLTVAVLFLGVICFISLLFPEGGRFGAGGWQFALCILLGAALGGILRARGSGKAPRHRQLHAIERSVKKGKQHL